MQRPAAISIDITQAYASYRPTQLKRSVEFG
jgi:hypothetical protein